MPSEIKWAIAIAVGAALILVGWKLPFLLTTVHVLACFLLIVVVLLQSGKAADLAGAFGGAGSQTAFGPRGAATFLSKATSWCAIMFMATSITLGLRTTLGAPSCGSGGTGRRTILRGWRRKAGGFESHLPHTKPQKTHLDIPDSRV